MSVFQIDRRSIATFDVLFLLLVIVINVLGIINLSSASAGTDLWKVQTWWLLISLGVASVVLVIDYKRFELLASPIYFLSLALLIGVHFFGRTVSGATSWYDFGILPRLQPSELMKIGIILIIARVYHRDTQLQPWGVRELIWPLALIAAPVISIIIEPDMGTALILLLLSATMLFFAGIKRMPLVVAVIIALLSIYPLWNWGLKPHQRDRVLTFIHPERDPLGAGYNALQSKIAVGSGGFLGKGYKQGPMNMLRFLPEQQTDFVFSVWAEEWGFWWVLAALALYLALIFRGIQSAQEAKDRFGVMIAVGCSALLFWHIFINIAMVSGLFPVIGIPLPFMSYGGSSLMTFMIAAALILNVRMRKYFF